jgi:hypothetical protein
MFGFVNTLQKGKGVAELDIVISKYCRHNAHAPSQCACPLVNRRSTGKQTRPIVNGPGPGLLTGFEDSIT